jgi:hypothetical protein
MIYVARNFYVGLRSVVKYVVTMGFVVRCKLSLAVRQ